jgi:uncharacterized protein YbbC (DUF1343 family)
MEYVVPRQSAVFTTLCAICALLVAACGGEGTAGTVSAANPETSGVRPGIEVLLTDSLHLVEGRRVGLITNHTGMDRQRRSTIDLLAEHPAVELIALYAPEHGLRGEANEGAMIESGIDEGTGVPIHSLYGDNRKPTPEMLEGVEVLLFDIQDVGARYYTYPSTMALGMEAAGEKGIPFVVLDRPNPIRGDVVQGNVLDPGYSTFVGKYPVPMRHGMTHGELARLIAGEFGVEVDLTVVPVDGLTRSMTFDDTALPWIAPSTNMPSVESALAYPGTCLFEGTPISIGRGTDRAFQWVGAPWLDGDVLAEAMNAYGFEGVRFEAVRFTPTSPSDGKFGGEELPGVRIVVEASDYDAPRVGVALVVETFRMTPPEQWEWRVAHFDRLAGTDDVREGIQAGLGIDDITASWDDGIAAFESLRAPYLIYR